MSVIKSHTGNSLNDYFSDLVEFNNMKDHLLQPDLDGFIRWFDKLRILEPRSTWIYLKMHQDKLTYAQRNYVEATYNKSLSKKHRQNPTE